MDCHRLGDVKMSTWGESLAISIAAIILLILIIRSCCMLSKHATSITEATVTTTGRSEGKLVGAQCQRVPIERRTKPSYNIFRLGSSTRPFFSWTDHPSLIKDAVENGWSRFAFSDYFSSLSSTSARLGFVGDLHHHRNSQKGSRVEITWEVGEGSVDFMQKIRMNSELKRFSSESSSISAKSAIRAALPLPGPSLGNYSSFPKEAYFEITILCVSSSIEEDEGKSKFEGEKVNLIKEKSSKGKGESDSVIYSAVKSKKPAPVMSLGLTSSSIIPLKFPGSYRGSVGFNSDGSVYLDGTKLVYESGDGSWGQQEEKVIGCGFDPRLKKVFFTVGSELVHVIHCNTDEFGAPLYPVIAANADVEVLINMGQGSFAYEPANTVRTPNPCFVGPRVSCSAALGCVDSGELFSMGRIDSGWCATESGPNSDVYSCHSGSYGNGTNRSRVNENGDESDADLFEIVLDVNRKPPDGK